ncbi:MULTISPECIES: hypothetical protein [Marinovum]|uniref:hypothetical protein n=1 Tax=Marinovum TaxID=367771 RepID=UPI00237C14D5|nr:hypothetical protein [Marinovum sp. PR37]MDD9746839.1 hypothetical protein [Marinovum sp. PR37]
MWKRLISLSLTFGLAALGPPASAQMTCGSRETIRSRLETVYQESLVGRGLQSATRMVEVWRASEQGNWTILVVTPEGLTCIVASGVAWSDATPKPLGVESQYRPG